MDLENIPCPYCANEISRVWAAELGFTVVRCRSCDLLYCNPRPTLNGISAAIRIGSHDLEARQLNVKARRVRAKIGQYRRLFADLFGDVWQSKRPISWLDVGAGYGEILEAVKLLAPDGSCIEGLEPMDAKAQVGRAKGLNITVDYLRKGHKPVDVISFVDVFSHVPDFGGLLKTASQVLSPGGLVFLETGNLADLDNRGDFPGELGLPDHLVFAGEKHINGFLKRAGFEIEVIQRQRTDGIGNLVKNSVKKVMGRPSAFGVPYQSAYRQLRVRAKLR